MSVRVFAAATEPGVVTLAPEESHYLARVRRVRPGAAVEVLDPGGGGWDAEVEHVDPKRAVVRLLQPLAPRPPFALDLAVGLTDTKAAYDVVARAVEGGARSLTFVTTERSQPTRLNAERTARVIAAARRQCGRLDPLPICEPLALATWLEQPRVGYVASLQTEAGGITTAQDIWVLLGPEGGLTPAEDGRARDAGLRALSLGPFVLRTEVAVTASIAAVGAISRV